MRIFRIIISMLTALSCAMMASCEKEAQAQGVTDTEILIGNTAVVTGDFGVLGQTFNVGLCAYLQNINDNGGVDGRKITLITYDDGNSAAEALSLTERLIKTDNVFAIVGQIGDKTVESSIDVINNSGIPVVYPATGSSIAYSSSRSASVGKTVFPVYPSKKEEGAMLLLRAVDVTGASKIGVFYTSDAAGTDYLSGIEAQAKELGDSVSLVTAAIAPGDDDITTAALKMRNAGVGTVIIVSGEATFATVIRTVFSYSLSQSVFITMSNGTEAQTQKYSEVYDDMPQKPSIYTSGWVQQNTGRWQAYVSDMLTYGADDYIFESYAYAGWLAADIFCTALGRMEGDIISWRGFIAAMESAPLELPLGGTVDYSGGKRAGAQSMFLKKLDPESLEFTIETDFEDCAAIFLRIKGE